MSRHDDFVRFNLFDCWAFVARHPGLILVLIGVIGEGVEIIPKIWFEKFYEKFKRKLEITGAVCWGVLVIGLAIELSEAAELDRDVASSNERSKQLESTNLQLRADIEVLRLARLEIEKQISPREIDITTTNLWEFAGTQALIISSTCDDCASLSRQFKYLLQMSGWKVEVVSTDKAVPSGVTIGACSTNVGRITYDENPQATVAASRIASLLNANGVQAKAEIINQHISRRFRGIAIVVGPKHSIAEPEQLKLTRKMSELAAKVFEKKDRTAGDEFWAAVARLQELDAEQRRNPSTNLTSRVLKSAMETDFGEYMLP